MTDRFTEEQRMLAPFFALGIVQSLTKEDQLFYMGADVNVDPHFEAITSTLTDYFNNEGSESKAFMARARFAELKEVAEYHLGGVPLITFNHFVHSLEEMAGIMPDFDAPIPF